MGLSNNEFEMTRRKKLDFPEKEAPESVIVAGDLNFITSMT